MSSQVRFTDFKSDKQPTWCPGCGDFGTMNGMMKALANTGNDPDNTFIVAGIGCSGKIGTYMHSYALHGVHGRALPVGTGVKMANPDLEVMVAGGDGDGYSIGAGHFVHAVRRNVDMSYVVMDNRIYGLTKGQASPTSREDFETATTPDGPTAVHHRRHSHARLAPLRSSAVSGATFSSITPRLNTEPAGSTTRSRTLYALTASCRLSLGAPQRAASRPYCCQSQSQKPTHETTITMAHQSQY